MVDFGVLVLAEIPNWVSGLCFLGAMLGGVMVSRWAAGNEAFEESHVTMGVLGFLALVAAGALVPGLFFDIDDGGRILLGMGLALAGLGSWMGSREMLKSRLLPMLCLLYVGLVAVVFIVNPTWYYESGMGTRGVLLIAATFAVPLSIGRLVAVGIGMEDLSGRVGVVLTALTLACWPMAKEVLVQKADDWAHQTAVEQYEKGEQAYEGVTSKSRSLEDKVPGLTVNYVEPQDTSDGTASVGAALPGGSDEK